MGAGVHELVDGKGRKYLTGDERGRFIAAARADPRPAVRTFAATLAHTGVRISEVPAVRAGDVDLERCEVRITTLERRREHRRSVPVPEALIHDLERAPQRRSVRRAEGVPVPEALIHDLELVHRLRRSRRHPVP